MKFRVLSGSHREGGAIYHEGDVIETNKDLVNIFANKFARVMEFTVDNPPTNEDIQKHMEEAKEEEAVVEEQTSEVVEDVQEDVVEDEAVVEIMDANQPFFVAKHKGGGKYIIVNQNADDKPLNENQLYTKEDAERVADELNANG